MKKKIVLAVTGSIAAFKSAEIASLLVQAGIEVDVIMTKEAQHFIGPLTLQMISGRKVHTEMFETADIWDVEHVSLADSADLILIAPATANIIGKLASGICDDLLTCVVMATKTKVLIAPAMNENMYTHKATQENIQRLKKIGYKFIGPGKGRLACGKTGIGRLAKADEIVKEVKRAL